MSVTLDGTTVIWYRLHVSWKRRKNVHTRCRQNCSFSQRKEASGHCSFHFLQSLPSKPTTCTMNCVYVDPLHVFDAITGAHQAGPTHNLWVRFTATPYMKRSGSHWISYSILEILRRAYQAWFPAKASVHSDSQSGFPRKGYVGKHNCVDKDLLVTILDNYIFRPLLAIFIFSSRS